jgi:hypothetical protein
VIDPAMKKYLAPLLASLLLPTVYAQVANNTALVGNVTDSAGSVVPGATVIAVNEATKVTYPGTANAEGYYSIPFIAPGTYDITVKGSGFETVVTRGIVVQPNASVRTDVALHVGSTNQTVTVTSSTPPLSTDDATVGETINQHAIDNLPVAGRRTMELAATSSNIIVGPKTSFTGNPPGEDFIGAGTREVTNSLTLDGITIMNSLISTSAVTPNPDAVAAVQTQTGNYTAQYGAYMGVHINMDTKSGTNTLHGSVYEYVQNDAFNAKPFFTLSTARTPVLRFNQFGGEVGGPIVIPHLFNGRDKMFFMGSYEGLRQVNQSQATATVLTAAERHGDFSALLNANPAVTLRNPATNAPYANNQVTNISSVATALLAYMPEPNVPGLTNNLNVSVPNNINSDQTLDRVDYIPTERVRLFGRYLWQKFSYVAGSPIPTSNSYSPTTDSNAAFGYTQIITPHFINDFHLGFNKLSTNILNYFAENNIKSAGAALGIPGFNSDVTNNNPGIPSVLISNFQELGSDGTNWYQDDRTVHAYDQISWTRGSHTIMAGADIRRMSIGRAAQNTPRGSFNFTGNYSGNAAADFLTGYATTVVTPVTQIKGSVAEWRNGFFVEDNWQVSPRLTLLYGLRYELPTVPYSLNGYGRIINRDYTALIPATDATSGATYKPQPGFKFIGPNHNLWAPRLGVAYRATDRIVIRGGGGIYYNPNHLNSFTLATGNYPLANTATYNGPTTSGSIDSLTFANPTGGGAPATPCIPGTIGCYTSVFNDNYYLPTPRLYQWNVDTGTELWRNAAFELQYLGSRGVHLDYSYYLNQPLPGPGSVNPRRPNQRFGQIRQIQNGGWSTYHGLTAILRQRLTRGLEANFSYTWSHDLDTSSDSNGGGTPMIDYDVYADYGNANWDIRNRFVGVVSYTLPAFDSLPRSLRLAASGWQANTIVTLQSGMPFNIGISNDQANAGNVGIQRPSAVQPNKAHCTLQTALDHTSCVRVAGVYTLPNLYTYGNIHRNDLFGPGYENVNLSVFKNFPIHERLTFQFRAEAFNVFNHPSPANPNFTLPSVPVATGSEIGNPATGNRVIDPATGLSAFGASNFGTITTVQNALQNGGGARLLQLAGRITF